MFLVDRSSPITLSQVAKELHYLLKLLVFVKKRLDGEMNHQGPLLPARRLHRRVFFSHQVSENSNVQTSILLVCLTVLASPFLPPGSTQRLYAAGRDRLAVLATPIVLGGKGP